MATNDHYVPQCLTRPWHDTTIGKQSLRFFDFEKGEFSHKNSEKLFARRGVNAPATETFLRDHIETPFAMVQDKIVAAGTDFAVIEQEFNKLPRTALAGIYWFQATRVADAKRRGAESQLDSFARKGLSWLDEVSRAFFELYQARLYAVTTPMFFPSTGIFPLPLADQAPAFALPIHPWLALVFADKKSSRSVLDGWMHDKAMPTAFSIALTATRVVVPPGEAFDASTIVETRARVRDMFEAMSQMGWESGLTTWGLDKA